MKRLAFCLLIVALTAGCGGGKTGPPVVRADGEIGAFQIDVTTEPQLRAELGQPTRVEKDLDPAITAPSGGRTLLYRCGPGCQTAYSFNNATDKLSDFWTQSRRFVTARGSHPGMNAAHAAGLEGKKVGPGCSGDVIPLRMDIHHAFVLGIWKGKVDTITYLGPHSVYYDGLC